MKRTSRRFLLTQLAGVSLLPLVAANREAHAETVTYTYDELGRLKTASYGNGQTITYTYDPAGNRITLVQTAPSPAPTSTLSALPGTITQGASSSLSWTSTNATSASINNGVGAVTPVAGGSVSVSPMTTTTYTLTASGPGGQSTSQATVTVNPGSGFNQTIQIAGTGPVNLRWLADAAGYNGAQNATVIFQLAAGVTITGAVNGGIAIDTGTWPTGTYAINLALQISGKAYGGGGNGGNGNAGAATAGGDALYCRAPLTVAVNAGGEIKAGGGGGGGGGRDRVGSGGEFFFYGGGGGGGGAPNGLAGAGGAGDGGNGASGSAGTTANGGAGGAGANGNDGGAGGGFAQSGVTGDPAYQAGGVAGAPGYAVRKNGNTVTVTNNGTIVGTQG